MDISQVVQDQQDQLRYQEQQDQLRYQIHQIQSHHKVGRLLFSAYPEADPIIYTRNSMDDYVMQSVSTSQSY